MLQSGYYIDKELKKTRCSCTCLIHIKLILNTVKDRKAPDYKSDNHLAKATKGVAPGKKLLGIVGTGISTVNPKPVLRSFAMVAA